jgi:hypothetical protein
VVAFQTPVELGGGFVAAPGLEEPPAGFVVPTLRAFSLRRRQGVQLVFFVTDNLDGGHSCQFFFGGLSHGPSGSVAITTVITDVRYCDFMLSFHLLKSEPRSALRAELQSDPPPSWLLTAP